MIPNSVERQAMIAEFNKIILKIVNKWASFRRSRIQLIATGYAESQHRNLKSLDDTVAKTETELHEALKLIDHYTAFVRFLDVAEAKGLSDETIQSVINSAPMPNNDDKIWWKGESTGEALYYKDLTGILLENDP